MQPSTIMIRALWRKFEDQVTTASVLVVGVCVCALGYGLAFMEVWTLENFPYYKQEDKHAMYVYGSIFYMLYFVVSFPLFFRIDEVRYPNQTRAVTWSMTQTAMEALANAYLITQACPHSVCVCEML
jgi:cycloeucalenol cycloisomerase